MDAGYGQPTLRVASIADAGKIVALVNKAYRPLSPDKGWTHEADLVAGQRTTIEQVEALFTAGSIILVLCKDPKIQDPEILACVHLQHADSRTYIGMLATEPACQAQGLGKQMLAHAEQYAVQHFNAASFHMWVLSSRAALISFYERRGYVRTGEVEDYPVSAGVGQPLVEGLTIEALERHPLKGAADQVSRNAT